MLKPIVEMFADVVTALNTSLLSEIQAVDESITGIHYMYGHPIEVMTILAEMSNGKTDKFNKFPAVILFQDFNEEFGDQNVHCKASGLNLIIATATQQELVSAQRYTNNFKPILYPIYFELIKQIAKYPGFDVKFRDAQQLQHTKTDRVYWGKNGLYGNSGNVFMDFIDAIEITNLSINIKKQNCQ